MESDGFCEQAKRYDIGPGVLGSQQSVMCGREESVKDARKTQIMTVWREEVDNDFKAHGHKLSATEGIGGGVGGNRSSYIAGDTAHRWSQKDTSRVQHAQAPPLDTRRNSGSSEVAGRF